MIKYLFCFWVLFVCENVVAQNSLTTDLTNANYALLSDNNYSIKDIVTDTSLQFVNNDTLRLSNGSTYWSRIQLTSKSKSLNNEYYLYCNPAVKSTLYYFNSVSQKYDSICSGFEVVNGNRHKGLLFPAAYNANTTLYIKMELADFLKHQNTFIPKFTINRADEINQKEKVQLIAWIVVIVILIFQFVNLTIDFIVFKEKTQLFYLLLLIGGIIYVTAFHKFSNQLFDLRLARYQYFDENYFYWYELSDLLSNVGILIILISSTYMTSTFLLLKEHSPKLDKAIKINLIFVCLIGISTILLTLFTPYVLLREYAFINNVFVIFSFLLLFIVSIICYVKKRRFSNLFLIANTIPFLIAIFTAAYLLRVSYNGYAMMFLPYLSLVSFTLTLAIALAFRNKNIQHELKLKEVEANGLRIENEKNITIKKSLKEKEILLKEIHHRVKNNLQVISSLLGLQSAAIKDDSTREIFAESKNKIQVISLIHESLYQNDDLAEIEMMSYFNSLHNSVSSLFREDGKHIQFNIQTNELKFDIDTSVPLGLIFNEVITNCYKYAFVGRNEGNILVMLQQVKQGTYLLEITDDGKGFDETAARPNSLGLELVKMLTSQLNGSFNLENNKGSKITISFEDTNQRKLSE